MKIKRISLQQVFMETAILFSRRSTCPRGQVGAVIVVDGRIVSTGYVGSLSGDDHCVDKGCLMDKRTNGCIRTLHGEMNAILFAARNGICINNSELYVTLSPCLSCAKAIISAGIKKIFYLNKYRIKDGINYLAEHKIHIINLKFK